MGLTIHYSCSLKKISSLKKLVDEVKDICESMPWEYHLWNENNLHEYSTQIHKEEWTPEDLYGISFSIPECEPFWLTFLPNGKLSSYFNILAAPVYDEYEWIYSVHTKTQFAGPDAHICLVKLLKHLQLKYLQDVSVSDEGNYWDTDNKEILLEQFTRYEQAFKIVEESLMNFKSLPGETSQQLADRLEEFLKNKMSGRSDE